MTKRLWVVRHAPIDTRGRAIGTTDVIADRPHEEAAREVIEVLRARAAAPGVVWSSMLERCAGLARCVAEQLGCSHMVDARLSELHLGLFEGRAWDALEQEAPDLLSSWMLRWQHEGPPGGESAQALAARVGAWLSERRVDNSPPEILLVAHAGVARALDVLLTQRSWCEAMDRPVPFLAIHAVYVICPPPDQG